MRGLSVPIYMSSRSQNAYFLRLKINCKSSLDLLWSPVSAHSQIVRNLSEKEIAMNTIGYARISSVGQSLDVQLQKLDFCDTIFNEKKSGKPKFRSSLRKPMIQQG